MSVKQSIKVTNAGLSPILSVAQGTGAIEYEFTVSDFDIPSGSAAVAYNIQPTGNIVSQTCSISGNTITVKPPAYYFLRGKNYMQFQVSRNNEDLFSFLIEVWCAPNISQPEVIVAENPSLVSQLISDVGLLSSQLDNLLSIPSGSLSTSADAALADIKVGWDGTTYDTPGDAVRGQIGELKGDLDKLDTLQTVTGKFIDSNNGQYTGYETFSVYIYDVSTMIGSTLNVSAYVHSRATYSITDAFGNVLMIGDTVTVGVGTLKQWTITIPENGAYLRVSNLHNYTDYPRVRLLVEPSLAKLFSEYSKILINSESIIMNNPEEPYNDFDTVPVGSVLVYSSAKGLLNAPSGNGGTLLTYNYTKLHTYGVTQLYVDGIKNKMYYRIRYGKNFPFTDWVQIASQDKVDEINNKINNKINNTLQTTNDVNLYTDMNDIPVNRVATFVGSTDILNSPPNTKNGTVFCFNYCTPYIGNPYGGAVQLFFELGVVKPRLYIRTAFSLPAIWTNWVQIASQDKVDEINNTMYTSISSFLRIGVIGDSYASGWLNVSGTAKDWYNISWIQQMARMNGVTGINFSRGGLTTRTWITDSMGLTKLNSENPCDLYYIVLGINDVNTLGADYLGSVDDIGSSFETCKDTFYGNMGKIIYSIKSKAPNSKIILSTMSFSGGTFDSYNAAIVNIANHFNVAYIVQLEDEFFTSPLYKNNKVGGHPTVMLYGGMAKAIERLTDKCMRNNIEYFNNIYPTS